MSNDALRIGNAQGFWGDSMDAPATLLAQQPDLDYLTLDYLAEVSLSIMAVQQQKDPSLGYARDFVEVVRSLSPAWRGGSKCKVVTNAGGLNPEGCAKACAAALRDAGCSHLKVAIVAGDDVLPLIKAADGGEELLKNLENGDPISSVKERLVTANAYLGAKPVADALVLGADIVITGRVADPSLVVGPCAYHYGWSWEDHDKIAGALIAGHIIECGAQVTGGISTNWLDVPNPETIGFPFVEMAPDGSCVVTKPVGSGGWVTEETVKEQLFYEIGDPADYLSPDARVSFMGLSLRDEGNDRVRVEGAKGSAPTPYYKVSATYRDGYWAQGMLTVFGRNAVKKAKRCGEIVIDRVRRAGFELERTNVECLGTGACGPGLFPEPELLETVLRISVADPRKEAVERFSKELAPLVTSGAQGVTGFSAGRPRVSPVFGYWPCLIEKGRVTPRVHVYESW
ncbi:MAG: DUF1446 domain-containing protein [Candidatus Hydrogenedentes bacterium]|nr:DUF1446 domain-containing protein [Candidatus Hydrogenedentota bacterium]